MKHMRQIGALFVLLGMLAAFALPLQKAQAQTAVTDEPPAIEEPVVKNADPLADDSYKSPYQDAPGVLQQTHFSDAEIDVLQSLAKRREALEKREKELATREALLNVAEAEVDNKISELKALRAEIEKLLGKQTDVQENRLRSLVKIYENMKPKEAATIMNTLEMGVLLDVIGRMSERRSAPILANMTPDRARAVTIRLAEQRKLPELNLPQK
ncbi:MAG: hypothetical protein HND56_11280 [Pseudomonadota bacterium]|nr:hypothetical protein [Pseudomonadota bacterium]QKK06233.1 MAG: hypothetical protein HND56_11280 [Pseudomonadota bacterium]